ncbi:replication protein A2, putative [Eimeria mitis]|uniref:Replication protein A2, putative n=1 Tax=Eimeria mitis TaxID=44415 RepID=U6JUD2_9EIME|nr:replication protein A2, putative [Eimeria mitis]CDJ27138.1 replication protein A2, putative [Eimeria mitis]
MSFAGLSGFDGSSAPPYGQGAPAQGSLGAPGDPGASGAPGEVRGVADFFGGGAAPGFGGGKQRSAQPQLFIFAPQGSLGAPGDPGASGAPGEVREDYFGGGGFLQTGNFLTQAQQPSGPQLSLIPVKIAHVYKAWMQDPSSLQVSYFPSAHVYKAWMQDPSSLQVSYFPSGPLLHLVKLIGVVDVPSREALEAALQSARIQFTLDDFTGRIECEYTVGDELTEYRQNQILDALCCGGLVTIFGSINLLGKSEPSLRVHAIRQTQTAADLIYHESACQAAYLRLKYPNEELDNAAAAGQQQPLQQQQQAQPFGVPQRIQGASHSAQAAFPFG